MKDAKRNNPVPPRVLQASGAEVPQPNPAPVLAANDGIDRRNFLSCMAWAGTGLLWTMAGGVPTSKLFAATSGEGSGSMRPWNVRLQLCANQRQPHRL